MFQLLLSADFLVPDADAMTDRLVDGLGLAPPRPSWRQAFDGHGFVATWLRMHPSLAVAPTRLETISYTDEPGAADPFFAEYLDSLVAFQGRHRPMKTHATVLVVSDLPALAEDLLRRRVPFRMAPWSKLMAFDRIWIGTSPERVAYRPTWDGGLMIECVPYDALQFPEAVLQSPPPGPTDPQPGDTVRVVGRSHLVRDLDETVRALAGLGLEPTEIGSLAAAGCRRARYTFEIGHGAWFEVIEPVRHSALPGRYLATWGPGPYATRLAVHDLDAKLDDLRRRSTRYTTTDDAAGPTATVSPDDVGGALVELVDETPPGSRSEG